MTFLRVSSEPIEYQNDRQLYRLAKDAHDKWSISAGEFLLLNNAVAAQINALRGAVSFPTAVDSRAFWNGFRKPNWLRSGEVRWTLLWTTDGVDTTNVSIQVRASEDDDGGDLTAAHDMAVAVSLTPSGTANQLGEDEVSSRLTVTGSGSMLSLRVRRDGNDSNTDDFYLLAVKCEYLAKP